MISKDLPKGTLRRSIYSHARSEAPVRCDAGSGYLPLSAAYDLLLAAGAEDNVNLRPALLGALSRGELFAYLHCAIGRIALPATMWEAIRANVVLCHMENIARDAAFRAAERASSFCRRFGATLPDGVGDGGLPPEKWSSLK